MKKKQAILFTALVLLLNASPLKAQTGTLIDSWQLGVNAIYDWQPECGGITDFRQATNIGIGITLQHAVSFHSVFCASVSAPGLLMSKQSEDVAASYDRYYSLVLDYRYFLNGNMFSIGSKQSGSIYFHAGLGARLMYISSLTAQLPIGVGYAKWLSTSAMLYAEVVATPGIEVFNIFAGKSLFGDPFFAGYHLAVGVAFDL